MKKRLEATIILGLSCVGPTFAADIAYIPACETPQHLVVVAGKDIPSLLGLPIAAIELYAKSESGLSPVTFQIDPRDSEGRYEIPPGSNPQTRAGEPVLDDNDELVFMAADAGARVDIDEHPAHAELTELRIDNPVSGKAGWIYASVSDRQDRFAETASVRYDPEADVVQTASYAIGFSRHKPFLIDTLRWNQGLSQQWSPDVLDTMKIHHRGRLFGFIDFKRTGDDYTSRLVAVRTGPLRIIRRTENAVRVLWKLKTPRVFVDYVMNPDGFVMDTIIDIPFRIGLFFSDIDTLTTIDWDSAPGLPRITVASPDSSATFAVNGKMNQEKKSFNTSGGTRFSASSAFGRVHVQLDIPEDFAITPWLYVNDDIATADPPEQVPGQFGQVGFRTTGWENIDTEVHHLKFHVCLQPGGVTQ